MQLQRVDSELKLGIFSLGIERKLEVYGAMRIRRNGKLSVVTKRVFYKPDKSLDLEHFSHFKRTVMPKLKLMFA